jgi:hypothetical protein
MDGRIGAGILGNFQDLEFLVHDYGPDAAEVFFPYPEKLAGRQNHGYGLLLFTFTPEGLRRAMSRTIVCPVAGVKRDSIAQAGKLPGR